MAKFEIFQDNDDEPNNFSTFSFCDFEESFESFNGSTNQNIYDLIKELENIGQMLNWIKLHKFVYAQRLFKVIAGALNNSSDDLSN